MGELSKEIIDACNAVSCTCNLLDSKQAKSLRSTIEKKYAEISNKSLPLWERLGLRNSLHDPLDLHHE